MSAFRGLAVLAAAALVGLTGFAGAAQAGTEEVSPSGESKPVTKRGEVDTPYGYIRLIGPMENNGGPEADTVYKGDGLYQVFARCYTVKVSGLHSAALKIVQQWPIGDQGLITTAHLNVRDDASLGPATITAKCGDDTLTWKFTVAAAPVVPTTTTTSVQPKPTTGNGNGSPTTTSQETPAGNAGGAPAAKPTEKPVARNVPAAPVKSEAQPLANTGADPLALLAGGLALVAVGGGLVLGYRRRGAAQR